MKIMIGTAVLALLTAWAPLPAQDELDKLIDRQFAIESERSAVRGDKALEAATAGFFGLDSPVLDEYGRFDICASIMASFGERNERKEVVARLREIENRARGWVLFTIVDTPNTVHVSVGISDGVNTLSKGYMFRFLDDRLTRVDLVTEFY